MASKRRERSLSSRSSHIKNKEIITLLEDRIYSNKYSRQRSTETEDEEDDIIETGIGAVSTEEPQTPAITKPPSSPDPNKFTPIPYIFRIPLDSDTKEIRKSYARSPPFYLQLDHTLAVIWSIFSQQPPTKPLGVAQLHWALNFLKTIKNENGEHPKDISLCIEIIQDQLLEIYAALANELSVDHSESQETKKTDERKSCNTETCSKIDKSTTENPPKRKDIVESNLGIMPFSVNYKEMMRNYSPSAQSTDTQAKYKNEQLKKPTSATRESKSREEMLKLLNMWRKEQLEKVETEVKRLHSLEDFIKNVDTESCAILCDKKSKKKVSIREDVEEKEL